MQEIPQILWNEEFCYLVKTTRHISLSRARLVQSNPPLHYFFKTHFNIILPPEPKSIFFEVYLPNPVLWFRILHRIFCLSV